MKISKVFFCMMASLLYLPFFACKPNDQAPVTKIISTSLKLNADPPSPQKYDRDHQIKFTAIITLSDSTDLVGGNVQFKYKYNNNDQDDWKNDCGDVPVSPLPDGTLQAVCDIDLKGGRHSVTAVYTGFKNVFKPSNTDKIEYEIIQSPTNIASFTTMPDAETFTFGDTIQLKIFMKKEQPSMPDFFSKDGKGGVAFSIMQTSSSLLRFFQPTPQSIDICTDPNDVQAVKDPDGITTTFTCAYKIIPNFITTEHSDRTPYSVQFSAHYLGNEYYKESPEITLEKTVNKISTSISNLLPDNSAYRSEGHPMTLRGFVSGEEQIVFSDAVLPTLMFDTSTPKNIPSCSWEKILIPSGSETSNTVRTEPTDLTNFHCTYTFADDDVTNCVKSNDDCHINVNYAGDSSHLSSPSAQFTIKLIKGHELSFTNVSVNPFVTVGEIININGTLSTKIPGDEKPVLNNLQFQKIDSNNQIVIVPINDVFKCTENSQISDGFNFTCTYQTKSGDVSYKTFKLVYDDSQNKSYYKNTSESLKTTINQIDASIHSVDPGNKLELNQATKITVTFDNMLKSIPISEKSIKLYKSTDNYKSTITCETSQMSDDSFSCSYQITKDDFNFDKSSHQITFRASINGDPNYKDTAIPVSSAATTIAPISTKQVKISSTTPASGVPYTISLTGSRDVVSADFPYTKPQISFEKSFDETNWTPANIDKCETSPSTTDGSFKNCIYSIKQEDTAHTTIYFRAIFTDDQGYYQTSTSPVSDGIKTIQDCAISTDPIDYQTCDLTKSCPKFKISCGWSSYGSSRTLEFQLSITKMTPTGKILFPDRPNSGKAYNRNYLDCGRTELGTALECYDLVPISDKFTIEGVLSWNQITIAKITNLTINITPLNNPSSSVTTCGQIQTSQSPTTIQRMFDCAMRVKNYAGYDNGSGQLITPDKPSDFKMAKSWYLVACPTPAAPDKPVDPNQCSWLSPELPKDTQLTNPFTVPDTWSDDSRPSTAVRSGTSVHGVPQSISTPTLIKDLIGKRILWSGVLEKPNQSNAPPADRKDLNFFYTNGFSPRPVEKSRNNFGYPDLLNEAENYGAYTGFLTLPQSPNAKCLNNGTTPWWDGAPWTPECWENQAIFDWRSNQFPINWHKKDQAYSNTICAPHGALPIEKQKCMGVIGENKGEGSVSDYWRAVRGDFATKANNGTTPNDKENLKRYAYTDVCQRRNGYKYAETFDRALINPGAYQSWQVPSYPILLTLTGKSSSDGDQNCASSSTKEEAITRCLVNNITNPIIKQQLNIAGFYATTNTTIPGFNKDAFLWSSDIVMDQFRSRGGRYCNDEPCQWSAFAFHDGAVMALGMNANVDVRCISLFW